MVNIAYREDESVIVSLPTHLSRLQAAVPVKLAIWSRFHSNQLLQGISSEVLQRFERHIELLSCEPNDVIFSEGDLGDALYLIARGSVKISKSGRGGHQETLTHLHPGSFFGEMALLDSNIRCAQATASERTILGRIDREAWNLLLQLAPQEVMVNFSRTASQRLRENNQHFVDEMMRSERLSLLGSTVASIIHDLRSPLTAIVGAAEFVTRQVSDECARKMAGIICKSVERMEGMVQELLEFSRGVTSLNLQEVTAEQLLEEVKAQELDRCRSLGVRVEIECECAEDHRFSLDLRRVSRVLVNLVRNACEAMPHGGALTIGMAIGSDGRFVITISDTGCGIPADLLPTVFEPFVTFGKARGTGLGLAIAKSAIEAHGGTIDVHSVRDKGTTFVVSLPG